jgi:hypothetical protein
LRGGAGAAHETLGVKGWFGWYWPLKYDGCFGRKPLPKSIRAHPNNELGLKKMTWEYRVMNRGGELAIYEVHYRADGTVAGYGAEPTFPAAGTIDELRGNCQQYLAALEKPALVFEEE